MILAISLQEIMTATPAEIETHAETVRNRLREIHEELRVDFPVYVLFTKADLVGTRWAESPGGPPRKYYRLTAAGRTSLADGATAWVELRGAMTEILGTDAP